MVQETQRDSGINDQLGEANASQREADMQATEAAPAGGSQLPRESGRSMSAPEKGKSAFEMEKEANKQKRTPGLWIVDNVIYHINNFAVFAISVVATYLTSHGDTKGGKFGQFMFKRGEWFKNKAMGMGMNKNQADMAKMVTFSFLDGTLMAPFVKMMEDRREGMAQWIDKRLGKEPADKSVYAAEPKQSWGSVLLGRALVAGVVVPTAVLMDKITVKGDTALPKAMEKISGGKISAKGMLNDKGEFQNHFNMNDLFFNEWGRGVGEKFVAKHPDFAAKHKDIHIPGLFKTGFFEAFYTSVCTVGLYVSSRFIARKTGKKEQEAKPEQENPVATANQSEAAPREEAKPSQAHSRDSRATEGEARNHLSEKTELPSDWAQKVGAETRQTPPAKQADDWKTRASQRDSEATHALS